MLVDRDPNAIMSLYGILNEKGQFKEPSLNTHQYLDSPNLAKSVFCKLKQVLRHLLGKNLISGILKSLAVLGSEQQMREDFQ